MYRVPVLLHLVILHKRRLKGKNTGEDELLYCKYSRMPLDRESSGLRILLRKRELQSVVIKLVVYSSKPWTRLPIISISFNQ